MERATADGSDAEPVRVLVVESSELDCAVLLQEMRRQRLQPQALRVDSVAALCAALDTEHWDAVISELQLPALSGTEALHIVRSRGLELPFIIVSGAIGEDLAVSAMQAGADDFLIKGRLARLGLAMRQGMSAANVRKERTSARRALAESERRLRELTDHLQQAVEAERAAIAREVHDDIGGMLTALRFDLSWIERHGQEALKARAQQGLDTLDQAVAAVQRILRDLRPPALDAGLVAALEYLVRQISSRTGLNVQLSCNQDRVDVSEQVAITVYRVAQESLTNVAKHARASSVRLDLVMRNDLLSLEITDDGIGIRPTDLGKDSSFGLRGLNERVRQIGGWLEVATGEPHGSLMLTIPLTDAAARLLESEPQS